jgi:hypothetical protein
MEGLKIIFNKNNVYLDAASSVTGFNCTVQNALANIATRVGTDKIYTEKGTDILLSAVSGKIVGMNDANHEAQAASINSLFFSREYETSSDDAIRLGSVSIEPISYSGESLLLNTSFTDVAQTATVGTTTIL